MRTKATVTEVIMATLLLLPFIYLVLIWSQLPALIPGHYGADGQPDRYDPKGQLAGVMIGVTVFLYLVLRFSPRIDPRKNLHTSLYVKIRWVVTIFWSVFLTWFWTISWKGVSPDTPRISTLVGIGLFITCLGNFMNTIKPNYFVGIRTPWTLQSDTVWRKTHLLGGRLMVIGGLLSILLALTIPKPYTFGVVIGIILLVALTTVVYSFIYFQREKSTAA